MIDLSHNFKRWGQSQIGTLVIVAVLYAGICAALLHPYFFHPATTVNGDNDVLLNIWIMQWTFHQLFHDPLHLFDGNIFYPNERSLAYSEVLFPNALVSGVVTMLSGNPILAYNWVFFLMIIGSALAIYYFTRSLTKSFTAAFIAGAIFAFPIKNMGLLQLKSSFGIPLTFLFFFRYFHKKDRKSLVLFSVFFVLQSLSCLYYGFYLLLCFSILFPFMLYGFRKDLNLRFFIWGLIGILGISVMLSPFLYQYYQTKKDFGFKRQPEDVSGADLKDFFTPTFIEFIPKKMKDLKALLKPYKKKKVNFGLIALALAIYGWVSFSKRRKMRLKSSEMRKRVTSSVYQWGKRLLFVVLVFISSSLVIFHISGLDSMSFLFYTLTMSNYVIFFRVVGIGLSLYLLYRYILLLRDETEILPKIFYSVIFIGIVGIALAMGDILYIFNRPYGDGPYVWVYKYFPGFTGLRAYHRFSILAFFSLAFLAGWGAKSIGEKLKTPWLRYTFVILLCFFLVAEYKVTGQKKGRFQFPHGQGIPETYRWLKTIKGEKIIVEFPFRKIVQKKKDRKIELSPKQANLYMYYSTFHWKTLVNGRSGFFPPSDFFLSQHFLDFPTFENLYLLREIGVDYIIDHQSADNNIEMIPAGKEKYALFTNPTGILKLEKQFDDDLVYSFNENFKPDWPEKLMACEIELIPSSVFEISAPFQVREEESAEKATVLGQSLNEKTRFVSIIQIDFQKPEHICRFDISFPSIKKTAEALSFQVSTDGKDWTPIKAFADKYRLFLNILGSKRKKPLDSYRMIYYADLDRVRHIRLINLEEPSLRIWFKRIEFFRKK